MLVTHSQIPLVSLSSSFHEATVRAVLSGSPVAHFRVEFALFALVWWVPFFASGFPCILNLFRFGCTPDHSWTLCAPLRR